MIIYSGQELVVEEKKQEKEMRHENFYGTLLYHPGAKLTSISELQRGDHISRPGKIADGKLYHHHAIVWEVDAEKNELTVIHLTRENSVSCVREAIWNFTDSKLYKILYKPGETLPVKEIVQNANKFLGRKGTIF